MKTKNYKKIKKKKMKTTKNKCLNLKYKRKSGVILLDKSLVCSQLLESNVCSSLNSPGSASTGVFNNPVTYTIYSWLQIQRLAFVPLQL